MDSSDLSVLYVAGILVCFQAEIVEPCTQRFTNSRSGLILSPNYPNNYNNYMYCTWEIKLPNGGRIVLNFHDFEIEYDSECDDDYLKITEQGNDHDHILLQKSCGTSMKSKTKVSLSDSILVVFRSDWSVKKRGFNITWDACGGIFNDSSLPVTSPKSQFDHETITCSFHLMIQGSLLAIKVNFSQTNFGSYHEYCLIQVIDSDDQPVGEICSDADSRIYVGTTNKVTVNFKLIHESNVALNASFSKYECSEILPDTSGLLQSPNNPRPFGRNSICDYTFNFTIPVEQLLEIRFNDLDVNCSGPDVLKIFQYESNDNISVVDVCTDNKTDILYLKNRASVRFISTYDDYFARFSMNYSIIECKETVSSTSGVLQSPEYPKPFGRYFVCNYNFNFTILTKQLMEIGFNDLKINCNGADVLQFYQYDSSDNASMIEVCTDNTTDILYLKNRISIRFLSTYDDYSARFSMYYSVIDEPTKNVFDAVNAETHVNKSQVPVIIGAVAGVIFGISAIAVLIGVTLCRRKREKPQTKPENIGIDVIYANNPEEIIQFQREQQATLDQTENAKQYTSNQESSERQFNLRLSSPTSRETGAVEANSLYAETDDGDYDVLRKARQKVVAEKGDNLYDISVKVDGQYDTTQRYSSPDIDSEDEMYDRTNQFHGNDNIYDKAGMC